ncbi:MAG: YfhO family protein, partial [Nitrospirota bacterium]
GYGMYRFLSGYLNAEGWVSVTGGVCFALNMQLTSLFALYTFSYAFPLYFAWSFTGSQDNRILKLLGLNLFVALSYPVLTLPYFFFLETLIIVLLPPEGQNARLRMLVKTSLVWFGYILICLPVLYGLYKYIPYSHRTYMYDAASFTVFLKNLHNGFIGSSLTTMTLIPLAGAVAIVDKSARVRRALIVIAVVVFLSTVFSPALNIIFKGTLLEKMDLGHITTVFPIVTTMAAFMAIDAVIKDRRLVRHFLTGAAVGAAYAVFTVFITKTLETQGTQTFILNIGSGAFISFMIAENKGEMAALKILNNPATAFIISLTAIAAVFYFSPKTLTTAGLISITPVLLVTVFTFFGLSKSSVLRANAILILAAAIFFSVRFTRFFGEESVPYISIFPDISVMEKLRADDNHSGPFRVASLDFVYIPMVQNRGFETPDGRGPLFNKHYREFIAILRAPQLDNFIVRHNFETNRYNLFISDGFAGFYLYPYAFLNNKYFVITTDKSGSGPNDNFKTIYTGTTTDDYTGIWKNIVSFYARPISVVKCNAAFDRWYLVKKTSVLQSDEDVYSAILKSEGESLIDTAYYSNSSGADMTIGPKLPTVPNGVLSTGDKIIAKHYSPDEIRLDAEVTSPAVLVVSNNYDPNWRAYVDGQTTTVLRTNLAFQSIAIKSPGRHTVVFKYEDTVQKYMLLFIPLGMLVFNYFIIIRQSPIDGVQGTSSLPGV